MRGPDTKEIKPLSLLVKLDDRAEDPIWLSDYEVLVKSFSWNDDNHRNHVQIPSRDARYVRTGLGLTMGMGFRPLLSNPDSFIEKKLLAAGFRIDDRTTELSILVHSYKYEANFLPHGSPVAKLAFIQLTMASEVDG